MEFLKLYDETASIYVVASAVASCVTAGCRQTSSDSPIPLILKAVVQLSPWTPAERTYLNSGYTAKPSAVPT